MKVNHSKSIRFAIAAALAVGTCQIAGAVGLGPISVNSHIGEPLQASIRVNGLSASDAAKTKIKLADAAAYQSRGIAKLPSHDGLRFGLSPAGNGYIITVRSNQRIREPFINFLLSMNSGGKEIVREYAVFLDPVAGSSMPAVLSEPVSEAAPPAAESGLLDITPASSTSIGWQGKPAAAPAKPAPPVVKSAPAAPVAQATWNGKTYGPVQPGETLYSIANKVRPSENYSIQSVMRQIYRANRSAFSGHSLNSLMAGYTLNIPEFRQGAVAMPKPKRSTTAYQPAPQQKAAPPAAVASTMADVAEADATEIPSADATQIADNAAQEGMSVQDGLSDSGNDGTEADSSSDDGAVVQPALLNNDDADTSPADDSTDNAGAAVADHAANMGEAEHSAMDDGTPSDESTVNDEDTLVAEDVTAGSDDAMPETEVVDETADAIPPVDAQPALIAEESSNDGQDSAVEVVAPESETIQVAVPANSEPVVPAPEDAEDEGFLFTTYAILPMWQWLAISGAALVLIALLLFRQRRKAVDVGNEEDGLDADEMEAVLAKINAMDDDHDVSDSPLDDWDGDADVNEDIFAQAPEHSDVSLHKPSQPASHADEPSTDFLFDDEASVQPDAADDDFDFLEELGATDKPTPQSPDKSVEDDFFADGDVDWDEFGASATVEQSEKSASAAKPAAPVRQDSTTPSDTDWLDDLVFEGEEAPVRKVKPASTAPSSDEMEINLDLASSFIATGHGERAISWLEEVIEMGTAEQKARAEELMVKVRNA